MERGIESKFMGYNAPYDLTANGKKIEIKQRTSATFLKTRNHGAYYFRNLIGREQVDLYVLICGSLESPVVYVIPSPEIRKDMNVPAVHVGRSRLTQYLNRWDLV